MFGWVIVSRQLHFHIYYLFVGGMYFIMNIYICFSSYSAHGYVPIVSMGKAVAMASAALAAAAACARRRSGAPDTSMYTVPTVSTCSDTDKAQHGHNA
jgi:hypothetical protein